MADVKLLGQFGPKENSNQVAKFMKSWGLKKRLESFSYTVNQQMINRVPLELTLGGGSYTDGRKVVVGLPEPLFGKSKSAWIAALKALIGHEYGHCKYSDFSEAERVWKWGDKFFMDNYKKENGGAFVKNLLNAIEDGRMEKLQATDLPGLKKYFQFLNMTFWDIARPKKVALHDFMMELCYVATSGVDMQGFFEEYDLSTPCRIAVENSRADVYEAINVDSPKVCADIVIRICEKNADFIAEALSQPDKDQNGKSTGESAGEALEGQDNEYTSQPDQSENQSEGKPKQSNHVTDENQKRDDAQKAKEDQKAEEDKDENNEGSGNSSDFKEDDEEQDGKGTDSDSEENDEDDGNGGDGKDSDSKSESNSDQESDGSDSKGQNSSDDTHEDNTPEGESEKGESNPNQTDRTNTNDDSVSKNSIDSQKDNIDIKEALKVIQKGVETESGDDISKIDSDDKQHAKEEAASEKAKQANRLQGKEISNCLRSPYGSHYLSYTDGDPYGAGYVEPELFAQGKKFHKDLAEIFKNKAGFTRTNQRNGMLDVNNLWRMGLGEKDLFTKKGAPINSDYVASILIDNSGSMSSYCDGDAEKVEEARNACVVVEEGLKGIMPVKITRFDSNGDTIRHEEVKGWHQEGKTNYAAKMSLRTGCGNCDGFSIAVAAKELEKRPETHKILFVLSDGLPSDYPSNFDATNHVKQKVKEARDAGLTVIAVRFGDDNLLRDTGDAYQRMYEKDYISCHPDEIRGNLVKVLKKITR